MTRCDLEHLLKEVEGLRSLARGLLRDEHDVDDVLQETRLRAWRAAPESPRPWLARVVRNLSLNRLRGAGRRISHEIAAPAATAPPLPDEIASRMETQRRLAQAVADLAEPYRTTVFLRFFEDLTPSEIAAKLREPAGTVRSRLKRGLDLLRVRLDGDHGGDRRACGVALAAFGGIVPRGTGVPVASAVLALAVAGLMIATGAVIFLRPESGEATRGPGNARVADGASSDAEAQGPVAPADVRATRVLQGRVETAWGAPIAGATVVVAVLQPRGGWYPDDAAAVASAITAADGLFRFEVESGQTYRVAAGATGFAWTEAKPGPRTHGIVVTLFPSRRFTGVVVDEAGAPVADARVRAAPFLGEGASTGPDGAFELDAGPKGVNLMVEHPRFVRTLASELSPPARVVIGVPQTLSGSVLDAAGNPVAGAEVRVWARGTFDVLTDAAGRFRIEGFAAGQAGERAGEGPPEFWMRVDAGERGWRWDALVWTPGHELRIALPAVRILRVRVTENDRPVAHARVALTPAGRVEMSFEPERRIAWASTDPEGRLAFHVACASPQVALRLVDGDYVFAPPFNGYLSRDANDVAVAVVRRSRVRGRVVGPDGAPVVGASVWVEVSKRLEGKPPRGAYSTDDEGCFQFPLSPASAAVVARAFHDGHEIATSEPFVPEAGREYEFDFQLVALDPRRDLAGVVMTDDGGPAAMVHIVAQSQQLRDAGEAYSAPDGTFRIRGLREGVYQVSAASSPGRGATTEATTGVPVRIVLAKSAPPDPPVVPARASDPEPRAEITGRVLDAEGKPYPYERVPGIMWRRERAPGEERPPGGPKEWGKTRCDLEGRFAIRVPDEGTYRLQVQNVWPPVFRPVEGVRAGTRDLVLRPAKSGAITGRVRLADGTTPPWLRVYAVPLGQVGQDGRPRASDRRWIGEGAADVDKEGRFRIEGLLDDRYVIVADDECHAAAFRAAAIGDDVELVLEEGLSLAGRVVRKDGGSLSKSVVSMEDSLGIHRQKVVEPDGTFSFTGLPRGPCMVEVFGEERHSAAAEGIDAGTKDLVLTLEQHDEEEGERRTSGSRRETR